LAIRIFVGFGKPARTGLHRGIDSVDTAMEGAEQNFPIAAILST